MEMISKGQIADRTRFNFENNNFDGIIEYYNETLYWIIFDEEWKEKDKKNLFEMFNIQSTMVADFELIEDQTIDIDSIEEIDTYPHADTYDWEDVENNIKTTNILIQAVKHLNKEIQSIKEKI